MGKKSKKHKNGQSSAAQSDMSSQTETMQTNKQPQTPHWGHPSNEQQENKEAPAKKITRPEMDKNLWGRIGGVLCALIFIAVVVILVVVLPTDKQQERRAERRAENAEQKITEASEEITPKGDPVATSFMQPYTDDEFTYTFEGIDWIFTSEDEVGVGIPATLVEWTFKNFSRREGRSFVTFGNPFTMGVVQGHCAEVESLNFERSDNAGIPLAYTSCSADATDLITEFVIFQESKDIIVKRRSYSSADGVGDFEVISTQDITTLAQ
jgi:hypothetical protein